MVNLIWQISTHRESQRIKITLYHLYISFPPQNLPPFYKWNKIFYKFVKSLLMNMDR